jgi:hypothetical protein
MAEHGCSPGDFEGLEEGGARGDAECDEQDWLRLHEVRSDAPGAPIFTLRASRGGY